MIVFSFTLRELKDITKSEEKKRTFKTTYMKFLKNQIIKTRFEEMEGKKNQIRDFVENGGGYIIRKVIHWLREI